MKTEIYKYPSNTVIVITNDVEDFNVDTDRLYIDLNTDWADRNAWDAYNYDNIIEYVEMCVNRWEVLADITINEIDFVNSEARPE